MSEKVLILCFLLATFLFNLVIQTEIDNATLPAYVFTMSRICAIASKPWD